MDNIYNYLKESAARKYFSNSELYNEADYNPQQLFMFFKTTVGVIDMYNRVEEKFNSDVQMLINENNDLKSENHALNETIGHLETMLKKCIPSHIIFFLIVNVIIMTLSATFAILFYSVQLYIIDIYYLLCTFIISTTLFCTALRALADWRSMLNENK